MKAGRSSTSTHTHVLQSGAEWCEVYGFDATQLNFRTKIFLRQTCSFWFDHVQLQPADNQVDQYIIYVKITLFPSRDACPLLMWPNLMATAIKCVRFFNTVKVTSIVSDLKQAHMRLELHQIKILVMNSNVSLVNLLATHLHFSLCLFKNKWETKMK